LTYSLSAVYVYLFLLPDFLANKGHHIEPSVIDYCTDVFVEPAGLDRQDGKRPDGLTLIQWHGGRSLVWDVTVVSPLAATYVDRAATDAGTVADMAATRKTEKHSTLSSAYRFEPIAVENLGVFSSTTPNFISELGRRICVHTRDARETSYLFQRISIMLQRFNSVLLHDTLPVDLPDL